MTYPWAAEQLGIELIDDESGADRLSDLVGIAIRRNPRRAHLLVSTVLGKHIPVDPRRVLGAGERLGVLVARRLAGDAASAVVFGYAETATGLGHLVAQTLGADYVHSTRRDAGTPSVVSFDEEHSHAQRHAVLPEDPELLRRPTAIVLVDDELSTGRTALNTIAALQVYAPREHYVVATLVDVRDEVARAEFAHAARQFGVRIDVVSLAAGQVDIPDAVRNRATEIADSRPAPAPDRCAAARPSSRIASWPADVRVSGRHGFSADDGLGAHASARDSAAAISPGLMGDRVLVLGTEELMYVPLLIALELQQREPEREVRFSSTTRSPVVAIDAAGYPIRTALAFPSTDLAVDEPGLRFAYNVLPADGHKPFTDVVLVVDDVADSPVLTADDGLVAQLAAHAAVHVVVVPALTAVAVSR